MRITVLSQFAKGFIHSDLTSGKEFEKYLESTKWYLWHGDIEKAFDGEIKYCNKKKLAKYLEEFQIYVENNSPLVIHYGEKWRYGETISTAFVESTIYPLQTRTAVLNDEWHEHFSRWFPGFDIKNQIYALQNIVPPRVVVMHNKPRACLKILMQQNLIHLYSRFRIK
jgi:hypothetical protein